MHQRERVRSSIRSLSDEVICKRKSAVLCLRKLDFVEHEKVLQPYSAKGASPPITLVLNVGVSFTICT